MASVGLPFSATFHKSPGSDGNVNELLRMVPTEIQETIHMLFIIMWLQIPSTNYGRVSSQTLSTNMQKQTPYSAPHKLACFRKQKDPIHQLEDVIMALEDVKLFHKDNYALIVDFTSVFNTTDHDRMLWIMYDLGFPTEAIDAVRNLYESATTQVKLPSSEVCTGQIPVERGTIQGDTLSPFFFLLYMKPLLQWLHVGGRGYCPHLHPQRKRASDASGQQHQQCLLCRQPPAPWVT